jgi:dipeptidyl-peptidase-4
LKKLTNTAGVHDIKFNHAKTHYIDTYSNCNSPPLVTLHSLNDAAYVTALHSTNYDNTVPSALKSPEFFNFSTADGTILHGMLYHPPDSYGKGPHPTIVCVYGGPHVQQVTHSWFSTVDMRAQYLRTKGFLVVKIDNRGSARRGQAFEGAIKHNLGDIEVQDQVAGVKWLVERGVTDPLRVGIYGWSYGGYMALMCLSRAPDLFQVAVSGAPVTHWDGYDTCYTERYMGLPTDNPDGYDVSSVMAHVANITGKLLLIHGLIDENVHFRHTARLINALIKAGKQYDLLVFPDERHMPRRLEDRIYLERVIGNYFAQNL